LTSFDKDATPTGMSRCSFAVHFNCNPIFFIPRSLTYDCKSNLLYRNQRHATRMSRCTHQKVRHREVTPTLTARHLAKIDEGQHVA
jgi:hypothetical protein